MYLKMLVNNRGYTLLPVPGSEIQRRREKKSDRSGGQKPQEPDDLLSHE